MNKKNLLLLAFTLSAFTVINVQAQYEFTEKINLPNTIVKHQDNTGTCWSFATTSFLEAELIRMGKGEFNLSEMHTARKVYENKALNYVLRQGKANFSQGSLAHDVTNGIENFGLIPESIYSGLINGDSLHNHNELSRVAKGYLDGVIDSKHPSKEWFTGFQRILDTYLGEVPETFEWEGKSYTPVSFAESLGLKTDDYYHITSFSHHPFYKKFILEIPDNYSNQSFDNVPVDELMQIVDYALDNGYTISWDGDVSERTFSQGKGLAVIPKHYDADKWYTEPGEEIEVTQQLRQDAFMNYSTTDDHLMHLVGKAIDQNGTVYYIIKNSWGDVGKYHGYLYMSETYFKMKVVAITVHKEAIPKKLKEKLN